MDSIGFFIEKGIMILEVCFLCKNGHLLLSN